MKISINKEALHNLCDHLQQKVKRRYESIKVAYHQLNKRQRRLLMGAGMLLLLLLLSILLSTQVTPKKQFAHQQEHTVQFATAPTHLPPTTVKPKPLPVNTLNSEKWQTQFDQLKAISVAHYAAIQHQLQVIQLHLQTVASQHDIQQLQHRITLPKTPLLGKIHHLQATMNNIVKQTQPKIWVKPASVERYFRLVAVQGFSDGMRTIIDIDGNQTTLSAEQSCPACRGWVLHQMDFAHQSAVFTKHGKHRVWYVRLRANS